MTDCLLKPFKKEINYKVIILGLKNSGKTAIFYRLKFKEFEVTSPTIGFNTATIPYKTYYNFTIWDVSGTQSFNWTIPCEYKDTQSIIYVFDSTDEECVVKAKDELHKLAAEKNLQNCFFLILANKSDLPHAMSVTKLKRMLDLNAKVFRKRWFIQKTSAVTGVGLENIFQLLESELIIKTKN